MMPLTIFRSNVTQLGVLGDKMVIFLHRLSRKQKVFWKAILNKSCLEEYFRFPYLNGPTVEFQDQPLKSSYPNISKTITNFWTLFYHNCWNHKPFLAIWNKRGWSLKLGFGISGWNLLKISFYLSIFYDKLYKEADLLFLMIVKVINYVPRVLRACNNALKIAFVT